MSDMQGNYHAIAIAALLPCILYAKSIANMTSFPLDKAHGSFLLLECFLATATICSYQETANWLEAMSESNTLLSEPTWT